MSQLPLLLQRYTQNIKIQTILDGIRETGHQCWLQFYSMVFWFTFVVVNHWKLRLEPRVPTAAFERLDLSTHIKKIKSLETPHITINTSLHPPSDMSLKKHTLSSKPKSANHSQPQPPPFNNKISSAKHTLFSSWKHKHHYHHYYSPEQRSLPPWMSISPTPSPSPLALPLPWQQPLPTTRSLFVRRVSFGNDEIHHSSSSSSSSSSRGSRSEPSSPSILKSFTLKMKRRNSDLALEPQQQNTVATETSNSSRRRLSLSTFRRRTLSDIYSKQ